MATGLRNLTAQIRAAAQSGDAGALRPLIAQFRQEAKAAKQSQINAGERYSALEGESGLSKAHMGMASGLVNVARRGGQLLTPKKYEESLGVSDKDIESQKTTDEELASSLPGGVGRFITEAAVTAPIGGPAGAGVKLGVNAVKQAPKLARLAQLATEGAVMGELTSGDAAEGAALNVGLAGLLRGAKRLVGGSGKITPEANRLMDQGVEMTPGQMNPRGWVAQLEQGAEHVPVLGTVMKAQRGKLEETGIRSLFKKTFGTDFPRDTPFPEMVRETEAQLGRMYDNVRASAGPVKGGGGWNMLTAWKQAVDDPNLLVSQGARDQADAWLSGQFGALYKKGANVSGADLMKIRSRLRTEIRDASAQGGEKADVAKILKQAEDAITQQIDNALPPNAQRLLKETDALYGQYKPLEEVAHNAAGRAQGTPTINQVVSGLKKSAGQSRWSGRGAGKNQQFVEDLRNTAERTGRPTGAILPAAIFGGAVSPALLLGGTKTGAKLFAGRTGPQRGLQKLVRGAKATPGVKHMIEILRRGSAGPLSED